MGKYNKNIRNGDMLFSRDGTISLLDQLTEIVRHKGFPFIDSVDVQLILYGVLVSEEISDPERLGLVCTAKLDKKTIEEFVRMFPDGIERKSGRVITPADPEWEAGLAAPNP